MVEPATEWPQGMLTLSSESRCVDGLYQKQAVYQAVGTGVELQPDFWTHIQLCEVLAV